MGIVKFLIWVNIPCGGYIERTEDIYVIYIDDIYVTVSAIVSIF